MTVKEDLERRIAALPVAATPDEAFDAAMRVVAQVRDDVLEDLRRQLFTKPVEEKIDLLAQLTAKHEVDAAMMDLGFKKLIASLSVAG
jgi:hypothetical protein